MKSTKKRPLQFQVIAAYLNFLPICPIDGDILGAENKSFSIFSCNASLYRQEPFKVKEVGLSLFIFTAAPNLVIYLNCRFIFIFPFSNLNAWYFGKYHFCYSLFWLRPTAISYRAKISNAITEVAQNIKDWVYLTPLNNMSDVRIMFLR